MARKISDADRVVQFFTTAPDAEVKIVFDIVRGVVSRRQSKSGTKTTKAKSQPNQTSKEGEQS